MESVECLNEDAKKKIGQILYIEDGDDQITTGTKSRD